MQNLKMDKNMETLVVGTTTFNHKEDGQVLVSQKRSDHGFSDMNQLGYFGNIWVRSHTFAKAGDTNGGGHYHRFDHVTLLAVGSVEVEVEGHEPKRFDAPNFIVIDKDKKHKFTALTDGVVYYCVFALRDVDGEQTDIYSGDQTPYNIKPDSDWQKEQLRKLDENTTHED